MIQGALPQHTWTAPHMADQDLDPAIGPREWRRLSLSCRPEERRERYADGPRQMHRPRIVRHTRAREGEDTG